MARHSTPVAIFAAALAAATLATPATADHGGQFTTELRVPGEVTKVETHADPVSAFETGPRDGRAAYPGPASAGGSGGTPASSPAATCAGVPTTANDTTHAFHAAGTPVVKVVYAHASDQPDRFGTYASVIQAGVRAASDHYFLEAGDKSIRFDLGTAEGDACVDIETVHLPKTRGRYLSPMAGDCSAFPPPCTTFRSLLTDVISGVGTLGQRNFLVYADNIQSGLASGQATQIPDDSETTTAHDDGGLFAVVYGFGGNDFQGSTSTYPPGLTSYQHMQSVVHEISHTLGAVQDSAPNSTHAGHCRDEWDIMCYPDGGPLALYPVPPCDDDSHGPFHEAVDCGGDDYMNPSPLPMTYLDTHWNTYNSVFLCSFFGPSGCAPPDTVDPDTVITSAPEDGVTRDPTPDFSFMPVGEPAANFYCEIDDGGGEVCSSPWTSDPLADGEHTLEVRARDTSGNVDPSPASVDFEVDTTAPDTAVSGRHRFRTRKRQRVVRFALGSNEPASHFLCRMDGGASFPCARSFATRARRGRHTLSVRAVDVAGNTDATPAIHRFRVRGRRRR